MNWVMIVDLLEWNVDLGFNILQFSCVSKFESSQMLSERGENAVERER